MRSVSGAREVDHTIDAGEGGSVATIAVRVKLLFGENVTARLLVTGLEEVRRKRDDTKYYSTMDIDATRWSWSTGEGGKG